MAWSVEVLNAAVADELRALPKDVRSKFERIAQMIESFGLEKVHEPYIKRVEGRIWEMRLQGRDGIARALYVTALRQRVVVVRVFVKKTEKTPRREVELALRRARDVQ